MKLFKYFKNAITIIIMLVLIAVILSPVFFTVTNSFMSKRELSERYDSYQPEINHYTYINKQPLYPYPFTLEQYGAFLSDSNGYFFLYARSLAIALLITVGQTAVSIAVGFFFGKFTFWGKTLLLIVYVIVLFLPYSATLLPNYIMIRAMGLLNTQASLILPSIFSPLGTVIMTIFISSIPQDTFDAALLETKSLFKIMRYLLIPQIKHAIALTLIISFTEAWNMVEQPQALMENKLLHPLSVSLNSIFSESRVFNFAGGVLYILPVMLLLVAFEDILTNKMLDFDIIDGANLNVKD